MRSTCTGTHIQHDVAHGQTRSGEVVNAAIFVFNDVLHFILDFIFEPWDQFDCVFNGSGADLVPLLLSFVLSGTVVKPEVQKPFFEIFKLFRLNFDIKQNVACFQLFFDADEAIIILLEKVFNPLTFDSLYIKRRVKQIDLFLPFFS